MLHSVQQNNAVSKYYISKQPTIESSSRTNTTGRRKRRGFSLCKELANTFDRHYAQRDLKVQERLPQSQQILTQNSKQTPQRSQKGKFLSSLSSVKSQKLLIGQSISSDINTKSRIQLGRSRKNSRGKIPQPTDYHQMYNYTQKSTNSSRKIGNKLNNYNNCQKKYARISEYGIIRRK